MTTRIGTVVFDAPGATLEEYGANASAIASLYAELLGMRLLSRGDYYREAGWPADDGDDLDPMVMVDDPDRPNVAFEWSKPDYRPPRWPDPAHPQQVHVDVVVADPDAAHDVVVRHGGVLLRDGDGHRVYADAVGHPLCLRVDETTTRSRIDRVVFDCADPEPLAALYRPLLDLRRRTDHADGSVELRSDDPTRVAVALQPVAGHLPPRWPESTHPQQLHVDLAADDEEAAQSVAARHGATRLPYQGGGFVYADPAGHPFCLGE